MIEVVKKICELNGYKAYEGAIKEETPSHFVKPILCTNIDKSQYYMLYHKEVGSLEDLNSISERLIPKSLIKSEYYDPAFDKNHTSILILKTEDIENKELNEKIISIYADLYGSLKTVILYNDKQEISLKEFIRDKDLLVELRNYISEYNNYCSFINRGEDYLLYDIISKLFMAIPCFDLYDSSEYDSFPLKLKQIKKNDKVLLEEECCGIVAEGAFQDVCSVLNTNMKEHRKVANMYKANGIPFKFDYVFDKNGEEIIFTESNEKRPDVFTDEPRSDIFSYFKDKNKTEKDFKILQYIYSGKVFGLGIVYETKTEYEYPKLKTMVAVDPILYINEEMYEVLQLLRTITVKHFMFDNSILFYNFKNISSVNFIVRITEIGRRLDKVSFIYGVDTDNSRYIRYKYFKYNKLLKCIYNKM